MTTGEKIKALRKQKGLTQTALGEMIGVQKNAVSKWECGRVEAIPTDTIKALASLFGVRPSYLIDEWDNDPIDNITIFPAPEMKAWPVIGATACGDPVHREIYDQEIFAPADIHADAVFRCDGESMIGARIYDGDLVFIAFDRPVDNGGIYLVQVEDAYTLKRVYLGAEEIRLVSENPKEPTRIYSGPEAENVKVVGKAVYFMAPVV